MTVSIVQDTGQVPANSGTVSFTLGSTPAVGDVLVAFCSWNAFDRTISTPSGWVLTETVINANSQAISTFWHVVQSGDGTSWSFTVNTSGGNDYTSGVLYEVTGASTAAPVNVYAGATYGTATGTFATGSVAPTVLGCLPLAGWTTDGGQTFSSVSSGWAEDLSEDTSYHTTFAAHQTTNTTDTSTAVSCTLTITGTDVGASQILLIGPVPPPSPYITQSTDVAAGPAASIAFTLPVAPTPGDLLVAFTAYNYGGGERSITPPSGSWVQVDDTGAGEGSGDALATFYYVAQSGDPATWTFTIATTGGNDWGSGVLYEVTGQSTSAPVNKHSPAAYGGGTSAFTTASVTPSVLGTLPLAALTTDGSETLSSVSSGWLTDQVAAGGYHSSFSAHQRLLTADTVTAVSNTFTIGGADAGSSEILLIAPQPAPPAAAVTTAAGQAVRARLPRVLPRGRIASGKGAPVRNPVPGPVFTQKPFPVRAKTPLPRRGRIASCPGGPLPQSEGQYPYATPGAMWPGSIWPGDPLPASPGPLFYPATQPARARIISGGVPGTLVPRGRTYSNPGGPVRHPAAAPAFTPFTSAVRIRPALPPRGRTASNPGAPVRNPVIPAPVYPQHGPARAHPAPPRRGRIGSCPGIPVVPPSAPAPVYAPHGPVMARVPLPRRGRIASCPGGPVRNPTAGPKVYPLHGPIGNAHRAPGPHRKGSAQGNHGGPVTAVITRSLRFAAGTPYSSWQTGTPQSSWQTGTPQSSWQTGTPQT